MGKPDAIMRHLGDEKSGAEEHLFAEGQLINDNNFQHLDNGQLLLGEMFIEEDIAGDNEAPDAHIDIDCSTWQKSSDSLLIVPQEHRQTVLR